ncbi:MAG: hypothetical protein OXH59_18490 [Rhodospirillaceae bacterium]|nr:hypothetical protein [Rhodospirillaceae bacterium]
MATLRDELEELLGPDGLAALSAARGGRRAYVPRSPRDSHWLVEALGRERAGRLAWRYGGSRIDVPLGPPRDRNARIRELRASGRSASAIAAEVGLSERQVRRVLRD